MSVNEIVRELVRRTGDACGMRVSYMFGDWDYVSDRLAEWGKSQKTSPLKFPIVCLYSPYTEDRTRAQHSVAVDLLIMVNTKRDYTNEEREEHSFRKVLRPIYEELVRQIEKASDLISAPYGVGRCVPHRYTENYRYGRNGVRGSDGKQFGDFIDAIEITDLRITLKNSRCHAKRL